MRICCGRCLKVLIVITPTKCITLAKYECFGTFKLCEACFESKKKK